MKRNVLLSLILNSIFCMAQSYAQVNPVGHIFINENGTIPEGTFRLTNGGYEVYTIVSADKSFQPVSLYYGENNSDKEKVDAMTTDGKVPTSMNCFVVKTPEGYIMFDTGLPESKGGKTINRLASLNIHPTDIKAIYLTHSHFDHIGGLLDDVGNASYPNAALYISEQEYAYMNTTIAETAQLIENAYGNKIVVFKPGEILPGNILPIAAPGHTPGHTAYQIGTLLFVGDLLHGPAIQLIDYTICAAYDAERSQAIATRKNILSYAANNSLTVLGAHIPLNGVLF